MIDEKTVRRALMTARNVVQSVSSSSSQVTDPHVMNPDRMNRGGVPGKNVKEDSPAKRMIDDVYSRYPAHPFYSDQRGIMHGKDQVGIFKLSEHPFNPKSVFIDWLAAHPQRSGIGTKTLDALKEHAAQYGTTLSLSPWDKGTVSKSALKKFYTTKNKFNPVNPNAPLGTLMWSPEDDQKSDPDDITKSGGGDVEPKLRTDNPGGEWLEEQKNLSAKAGNHPSGAPKRFGAVTGNFRENLTLPLSVLSVLKGVSGEQANVRQNDLNWLKNHMQSGKLPPISDDNETEYAPFVTVDQNGRPWVNEGNHRIMAAHELGWRHMPVSVRYFSGGERVDGPFHPDRLLALHRHHVDKPRIAKAESGDDITKSEGGEVDDVPHKKFGGDLDDDGVSDFTPPKLRGTQIMKEPGGQWLSGSVEGSMSPLKTKTVATYRGTMETPELAKEIAERGISNIEKHPENSRDTRMMQLNDTLNTANRAKSVNDFVGKQLTRYVKNDMGTEGDPIRALAERGILHYVPHQNGNEHQTQDIEHDADLHRRGRGRASNSLAKQWENNSDLAIDQFEKSKVDKDTINENPWLDKLEPHDVVNRLFGHGVHRDLGFDHLIDELHNSVNPESGLPDRLQLRPESLARMSVPQAVQHVHNINEWRENNKAEANAKLAFNPATYLHKDYPGKDYAWYELKPSPNAKPPVPAVYGPGKHAVHGAFPRKFETEEEAHKYIKEFPENIRNANDHGQFDPILKNLHDLPLHYAGQNDEELEPFKPGEDKHLQDALKYEGDCMGHCVGGYHEDVAEGNSRIFSLRHKKTGAPHVTIETSPRALVRSDLVNHLGGNEKLADDYLEKGFKLRQDAWTSGDKHGLTPLGHALRLAGVPKVDDISQIKGKGNAKPTDRYLPYVQDFVKSGQWGRIGDLHNTGLHHVHPASDLAHELGKRNIPVPSYVNDNELTELNKSTQLGNYSIRSVAPSAQRAAQLQDQQPPQQPQGYAGGGPVYDPKEGLGAAPYKWLKSGKTVRPAYAGHIIDHAVGLSDNKAVRKALMVAKGRV